MDSHDDGSIPGLPSSYPLDPTLVDNIAHHDIHHQHQHQHQQHHVHQAHHHDQHQHDHTQLDDLDRDASIAAEFFASEAGGEMSLDDGSGLSREVEEPPMMSGSQDGDDQPMRKPRKRKLQLACHFCRRRKLKCDGIRPTCENCHKRNEACQWDEAVRRRGPGKRTKAIRDRAADDMGSAGLLEVAGMGTKLNLQHMDSVYHAESSSVADTNAALIAAVTAAAAEGAGGMDANFGDMSVGGGGDAYGAHEGLEGEGEGSPALTAHTGVSQALPDGTGLNDALDPNIDPSLADLGGGPSTLADVSTSPKLSASQQAQLAQQLQASGIRQQQIQAALQIQRQHQLQQQQQQQQSQSHHTVQQQRKLAGVGVGVGASSGVQVPTFGVSSIIQPNFGMSLQGSSSSQGLDPSGDGVDGTEGVAVDALDWDKGYNFSAWPDLDLGPTTH